MVEWNNNGTADGDEGYDIAQGYDSDEVCDEMRDMTVMRVAIAL